MESYQKLDQYDVSKPLSTVEYFSEFSQFLQENLYAKYAVDDHSKKSKIMRLAQMMGVELERCKEVEKKCRASQLNASGSGAASLKKEAQDDDCNLEEGAKYLESCRRQRQLVNTPQKHHRKLVHLNRWVPQELKTLSSGPSQAATAARAPATDVVVTVRVYKPFGAAHGRSQSVVVSQDILMHGSQRLSELRDVITCPNDDVLIGDVTQLSAVSGSQVVTVKSIMKSALLFIGDTFYSDERDVTNIKNYGEPISTWLAQQGVDSRVFRHQRMEQTRLDQLPLRLGYPYLYRHLDDCEHLLTFTDARLMTADDAQNVSDYPLVRMAPPDIIYCDGCNAFPSQWLVDDPQFCPNKWTHFCQNCFRSFFYSNGLFTSRPVTVHQFPQPKWPAPPTVATTPAPSGQPTLPTQLVITPEQVIIKSEDGCTLRAL